MLNCMNGISYFVKVMYTVIYNIYYMMYAFTLVMKVFASPSKKGYLHRVVKSDILNTMTWKILKTC